MIVYFAATLFLLTLAQQPNPPNWPKNVYVFDPSSSSSTQSTINSVFSQMGGHTPPFNGQWSNNRYAFLFKPGNHNVQVSVGFYTSVIGLGNSPSDTTVSSLQCPNGDFDYTGGALDNFWRSAENIAAGASLWAVSQACPLRRVSIRGDLALYQYNSGCCAGEASGGYLGDSTVSGTITSGSQQQWFTRNTQLGNWAGGVWNMVFVGNSGHATPDHCSNAGGNPWTTVGQTPVIAEKPYIAINAQGKYTLRVPHVETNKVGPTSNYNNVDQHDFSQVYVATESDSAATINSHLSQGLHVVLTPGNYQFSEALVISQANTVVIGIGFPVLTATNGNAVIQVNDVDGVRVGGFIFQAGRTKSQTLIEWGQTKNYGNPSNPGIMYDMFGRVGGTNNPGQYQVSATVMVTINHRYVVLDNSWLWRADHDISGSVKAGQNPSQNGLLVNGDNVVTYALAVEHHLQDGIVWNGDAGRCYFYQCELPYDVNEQQFGTPGYSGYKVGNTVKTHTAWGVGIYSFFRDFTVTTPSGIKSPTSSGIRFIHPFTRYLSGNGAIAHVLDDTGRAVNASSPLAYIC